MLQRGSIRAGSQASVPHGSHHDEGRAPIACELPSRIVTTRRTRRGVSGCDLVRGGRSRSRLGTSLIGLRVAPVLAGRTAQADEPCPPAAPARELRDRPCRGRSTARSRPCGGQAPVSVARGHRRLVRRVDPRGGRHADGSVAHLRLTRRSSPIARWVQPQPQHGRQTPSASSGLCVPPALRPVPLAAQPELTAAGSMTGRGACGSRRGAR